MLNIVFIIKTLHFIIIYYYKLFVFIVPDNIIVGCSTADTFLMVYLKTTFIFTYSISIMIIYIIIIIITQQQYITTNKTLDSNTSHTKHTNLIIRLIKTPSISH